MDLIIYQVDAFTKEPFGGNPAGVVTDARGLSDKDMQNIAKEMNLSETAFILPQEEGGYQVRFFTPQCEVDLCGHATIAAFYTLAHKGYMGSITSDIMETFQITKAGKLPVEIIFQDGEVIQVMMQQGKPKTIDLELDIRELAQAFNLNTDDIGLKNNKVLPQIVSTGLPDIILPLKSKGTLDYLEVNYSKLETISKKLGVTGVHAFVLDEENESKVYCRNFAPAVGIDEEAATGTANGALIYYLKKNDVLKGKTMTAYQGEIMGRPSTIHCSIETLDDGFVVKVGGEAHIIMEGVFLI